MTDRSNTKNSPTGAAVSGTTTFRSNIDTKLLMHAAEVAA